MVLNNEKDFWQWKSIRIARWGGVLSIKPMFRSAMVTVSQCMWLSCVSALLIRQRHWHVLKSRSTNNRAITKLYYFLKHGFSCLSLLNLGHGPQYLAVHHTMFMTLICHIMYDARITLSFRPNITQFAKPTRRRGSTINYFQ